MTIRIRETRSRFFSDMNSEETEDNKETTTQASNPQLETGLNKK